MPVRRESVSPKLAFEAEARDRRAQAVDFYGLSRMLQDRFLASTGGTAPPVPLLFAPAGKARVLKWLGAGGGFVLVALILARIGSGNVTSSLALQGPVMLLVYILLFAAAALCVVRAIELARASSALPYRPGVYVFAACVIDASGRMLKVRTMKDLANVERAGPSGSTFHLSFAGGAKMTFQVPSLETADQVERSVAEAREALRIALIDEAPSSMAVLDPLYDAAMSSPLSSREPLTPGAMTLARLGWIVAAVVAITLGPLLWLARNFVSDQAMFATVQAAQTIEVEKDYLARGGRHTPEVAQVLLPRSELHEAESQGTVEALLTFKDAHPDSKIAAEIDAALHRAYQNELDKAKKAATVTALRAFATKYPNSGLDRDYAAALHARFQAAMKDYRAQATADANAVAFVEKLLAWSEKHGPAMEVRFGQRPSKSLGRAETQMMKSNYYVGTASLPSRFLSADAMRDRETRAGQSFVDAFTAAFPADVLALRAGAPVADPDNPTTDVKVPTLAVVYAFEWSTVTATNNKPRTVLVGLNMPMEGTFAIPDVATPFKMKQNVWRGMEPWHYHDDSDTPGAPGTFEGKVYGSVADSGFDQIAKKLVDSFFAPQKK